MSDDRVRQAVLAMLRDQDEEASRRLSAERVWERVQQRSVADRPRPGVVLLGAAVVATVLVAVLALPRLLTHLRTPAGPAELTSPPPPALPVVFYRDPDDPTRSRLIAVDWSGHRVGVTQIPHLSSKQSVGTGPFVTQSMDGQRLLVTITGEPQRWILTSGGRVAGTIAPAPATGPGAYAYYDADFGNDGRTVCELRTADERAGGPGAPLVLVTQDQGGNEHRVADLPGGGDTERWGLSLCSIRAGSAVLVHSRWLASATPPQQSIDTVRAISLTTGRQLWSISPPPTSAFTVVASDDGRWIAAQDVDRRRVVVLDVRTGAVAGTVAGEGKLLGFGSGSEHLIMASSPDAATRPARMTEVDWRTGRAVWTASLPGDVEEMLLQPDGDGIAVFVSTPGRCGTELVLIHKGRVQEVARDTGQC